MEDPFEQNGHFYAAYVLQYFDNFYDAVPEKPQCRISSFLLSQVGCDRKLYHRQTQNLLPIE